MSDKKNINRVDQQIDRQLDAVADARSKQASGFDAASDYIEVKGVKFYRHTLAHTWLFQRLSCVPMPSRSDLGVCLCYILAHRQDEVRNRLMAELDRGTLVSAAYGFAIDHGFEIKDYDPVVIELGFKSGLMKIVDPEAKPEGEPEKNV